MMYATMLQEVQFSCVFLACLHVFEPRHTAAPLTSKKVKQTRKLEGK